MAFSTQNYKMAVCIKTPRAKMKRKSASCSKEVLLVRYLKEVKPYVKEKSLTTSIWTD